VPRSRPLWRKGFDTIERSVGRPLESVARSEVFFDLLAVSTRARRRAVNRLQLVSSNALHLVNLPTSSDVRQLREQITRMERRMAGLTKQIDDWSEDQANVRSRQP
jgi:hypothetical protein